MNPPAPACLYGRVRSFALFAADDPCAAPDPEATAPSADERLVANNHPAWRYPVRSFQREIVRTPQVCGSTPSAVAALFGGRLMDAWAHLAGDALDAAAQGRTFPPADSRNGPSAKDARLLRRAAPFVLARPDIAAAPLPGHRVAEPDAPTFADWVRSECELPDVSPPSLDRTPVLARGPASLRGMFDGGYFLLWSLTAKTTTERRSREQSADARRAQPAAARPQNCIDYNPSLEQHLQSARREEWMLRILRKGKLHRLVEDLAVWWNEHNIHSIEAITHSLNYNAKMRSDFIPRGIDISEVLPFSPSEVRRIVEACGKSDILRS